MRNLYNVNGCSFSFFLCVSLASLYHRMSYGFKKTFLCVIFHVKHFVISLVKWGTSEKKKVNEMVFCVSITCMAVIYRCIYIYLCTSLSQSINPYKCNKLCKFNQLKV